VIKMWRIFRFLKRNRKKQTPVQPQKPPVQRRLITVSKDDVVRSIEANNGKITRPIISAIRELGEHDRKEMHEILGTLSEEQRRQYNKILDDEEVLKKNRR